MDTELTSYCFEGAGDSEARSWDPMFVESIGSNSESESLRDSPNCYNNQAFLSFEIIGYGELDMITFNYAP